jgi:hypothetical protein
MSDGEIEQGDVVAFEPPHGTGIADATVVAVLDTGDAQLDDGRLMPIDELKVVA